MANFLVDHEFTLDITPSARPQLVPVSEYDVGRIFTFTLKHNGEEMTIPSSYGAVTVEGTIGSYAFSEPASIENGKIVFQLTESMTAHAGKAWTKIKFANADAPVSTCAFFLVVDRAGVEADTVIGAPGFQEQINEGIAEYFDNDPPFFELPSGGQSGQALLSDGSNGAYWGQAQGGGSGLTDEVKSALMNVASHIGAWTDGNAQTYIQALYDALYPPVDVLAISAVFTQGDNVIYDTDSLDTLKQYLVVTATMTDSTTRTVTNYTLSGTLTVGTSTITVSYGGKTATFNVTVSDSADRPIPSEYQEVEYIESVPNSSVNSPYIDTGIYLDGDSRIKARIAAVGTQSGKNLFGISENLSGASGAIGIISFSSAQKIGFYYFGASVQAIAYDTNFHDYEISPDGVSVDGVSYQLSGTVTPETISRTLWLFDYRVSNYYNNVIPLRYGRIQINDKTFVPCYRKADGEIGMYEMLSGTFMPNSGTAGSFTKGADVT